VECFSGFTSISLTTSLTLGTALASLFASFRCGWVFTLPFKTSDPFVELYEMLWASRFLCASNAALCARFHTSPWPS